MLPRASHLRGQNPETRDQRRAEMCIYPLPWLEQKLGRVGPRDKDFEVHIRECRQEGLQFYLPFA